MEDYAGSKAHREVQEENFTGILVLVGWKAVTSKGGRQKRGCEC